MKKPNYLQHLLKLVILMSAICMYSCHKENPLKKADVPYLRGMLVTWNERMKMQGSHMRASSPYDSWFTPADVKRMKAAGATCLELHQIGLPEMMPEKDMIDDAFFSGWLDVWVDWCTQNQLYCIINVTGFGAWADWAFYQSMPDWLWEDIRPGLNYSDKSACDSIIRYFFDMDVKEQEGNRAAFVNLWKFIADHYKNNQYVMYSIMNEPFWEVDIPDESTAAHLGQSYSTFMEQITDNIRSTGATQPVLIDLPFLWDNNWQFTVQPVDRDNIIWEAHMYGSVWEPGLQTFRSNLFKITQLFVHDFERPLFIGEYGINPIISIHDNSAVDWKSVISAEINYLDSLPITGRQFTAWDQMNGEYALFSGESNLTAEETEWIMHATLSGL